MQDKYYAGIGARTTPPNICAIMTAFAYYMGKQGWTLRSGGADGADKAFERGAIDAAVGKPFKEVFKPKDCTADAIAVAKTVLTPEHWVNCDDWAQNAHGRNCMQVLGRDLKTPVQFVVCWTEDGEIIGGTATAIKLAMRLNIPIYNLGWPTGLRDFFSLWRDIVENGEPKDYL